MRRLDHQRLGADHAIAPDLGHRAEPAILGERAERVGDLARGQRIEQRRVGMGDVRARRSPVRRGPCRRIVGGLAGRCPDRLATREVGAFGLGFAGLAAFTAFFEDAMRRTIHAFRSATGVGRLIPHGSSPQLFASLASLASLPARPTGCSAAYADQPVAGPALPPAHIALDIAPARIRAPYDVQIMREDGETLPTYSLKDRFYVQGNANDRYIIRITNPTAAGSKRWSRSMGST